MGKLMERFGELCTERNQIFADCKKSLEEGKDDKFILTDKGGRRERIIPFTKILLYRHNYGATYSLFGVACTEDFRCNSIDAVCFDSASHFRHFPISSLPLDKQFEIADMIKEYNPKEATEYDSEETRKFIGKLCKKK